MSACLRRWKSDFDILIMNSLAELFAHAHQMCLIAVDLNESGVEPYLCEQFFQSAIKKLMVMSKALSQGAQKTFSSDFSKQPFW